MFRLILALIGGYTREAEERADQIHATVWMAIIGMMITVGLMFAINVAGAPEVNYIVLLVALVILGMSFTSPRAIVVAGAAGGAVNWLGDKDVSQGIVGGWKGLAIAMGTTMFVFTALAGLLAIVPFKGNASAFPPIATMLVALGLCFGISKNGTLRTIMLLIAALVIGWNGWKLTPTEFKDVLKPTPTATQPVQVPSQSAPKKVHTGSPVWTTGTEGGTFPVGECSVETPIRGGCSVKFSIPDGVRIEYRFKSKEWKRYELGSSPDATHLRWCAMVEGITDAPYTMTCPP